MQINEQKQLTFKFYYIPLGGLISITFAIGLSYIVAVQQGHVNPFPNTDITHCTIQYPEYFFARIGFPATTIFLALNWSVIVYFLNKNVQIINIVQDKRQQIKDKIVLSKTPEEQQFYHNILKNGDIFNQIKEKQEGYDITIPGKRIVIVGYIACILFLISICVVTESDMNWTWHIFGATGFFVLAFFNLLWISNAYKRIWKIYPHFVKKYSYDYKQLTTQISYLTIITIIMQNIKPYSEYFPKWFGNFQEWFLVLVLMIYIYTFAVDYYNIEWVYSHKTNQAINAGEQLYQGNTISQILETDVSSNQQQLIQTSNNI